MASLSSKVEKTAKQDYCRRPPSDKLHAVPAVTSGAASEQNDYIVTMPGSERFEPIKFRTLDGTSIAGNLYAVKGPAPAVIMSHGFNCVKEMTLPDVAEAFQSHGFNALLYDARSVGESGGTPQNLIDPLQFAEDLSDICTQVASLPNVDSRRIAFWGMSLGGAVSSCAAAIDRRPKAVVMVCPLLSYVKPEKADNAYAMLIKDRVSQTRGNEAYSLPPFTPQGDNPIGMAGAGGPGGLEAYTLMKAAAATETGHFRDRLTLQSYQKLALFRPKEYLDMLKAPVMMIVPDLDDISPPEEQEAAFAQIPTSKRMYVAKGKRHLDAVTGEGSQELIAATCSFLSECFEGTLDQ